MRTLYSVWNPSIPGFDYYAGSGRLREGTIAAPSILSQGGALGLSPERAARPLPSDAQYLGSGRTVRGMIASRGGPASALGALGGMVPDWLVALGAAAAGYYLATRTRS